MNSIDKIDHEPTPKSLNSKLVITVCSVLLKTRPDSKNLAIYLWGDGRP